MKRVLSLLLVVCLFSGMVAGCGKSDEEKEEYASKEMIEVNVNGVCSFSIPKEWEYKRGHDINQFDSTGFYVYTFDNGEGYFRIDCTHFDNGNGIEELISDLGNGREFSYDDLTQVNQEDIEMDGQDRILYESTCEDTYDVKEKGTLKYAAAAYGQGCVEFNLFVKEEATQNYMSIFKEILGTVKFDMTPYPANNEEDAQEDTVELTGNLLLDTELKIASVTSGAGDVIGSRGEQSISKDELKTVSQEQFQEYMNKRVLDSYKSANLKWVTIMFGDGTGLHFMPGTAMATYGKVDGEGAIEEQIGVVAIQDDGTYSYNGF